MSNTESLDIHLFQNDKEKILVVLYNEEWLNASEIANKLGEHGVGIHWKRVTSLLESEQDLTQRKKIDRRWHYKLLKKGIDRIQKQVSVLLIEPTKAVQCVSNMQELLKKLSGTIKICDPYVDDTIFKYLDSCSLSTRIRILSNNLKNISQIQLLIAAHKTKGRIIELKNTSTNVLHDRYIIDNYSMTLLGTSFNGLGKKQSFIIKLGQDIRATTEAYFDDLWTKAITI